MAGKLNPIVTRALGSITENDPDARDLYEQFTDLTVRPNQSSWGGSVRAPMSAPNAQTFGLPPALLRPVARQSALNVMDAGKSIGGTIKDVLGGLSSALGSLGKGGGGKYSSIMGGGAGKADIERIMATIRQLESGNNYTIRNTWVPSNTASGAYQFIDSTWGGYGGYRSAWMAPKAVQDAKAREMITSILNSNGWDIRAVPGMWYSPKHWQAGQLGVVPYPSAGNTVTLGQYIDRWMRAYNSL